MKPLLRSLCLALALLAPATAHAQPLDPAEVTRFVEAFFDPLVTEGRLPGVFVAVVQGQTVIAQTGLGWQDIAANRPIDPENTVFRVASISKAFTNIAILNLAAQGRLDLQADIQTYLPGLAITGGFDAPITVDDLLAHVEGYEETYTESITPQGRALPDMLTYLIRNQPSRIYPPKEELTYGSYGTILLGRIIENVTGLPFDQAMETVFFSPLGMGHSAFTQPIPATVMEDLAQEYMYENNRFSKATFIYPSAPPAGSAYASGNDIVAFLKYLTDRPPMLLSQQAYSPAAGLPGITRVFFEQQINGHATLTRNGDGAAFRSTVYLVPDSDLALFMVYTSDDNKLRNAFVEAFFNRFLPGPEVSIPAVEMPQINGIFRPVQANRTGLTKIQQLFVGTITVTTENGRLLVDPGENGDVYGGFEAPMRFVPMGNGLFVTADGNHRLAVYEKDGETRIATGFGYHGSFAPIAALENPVLHLVVAIFWAGVLFVAILVLGWKAVQRCCDARCKTAMAAVGLAVIYAGGVNYALIFGDSAGAQFGLPSYFFAVPAVTSVFTALIYPLVAVSILFVGLTMQRTKGIPAMASGILILALAALIWQGWYWNLAG